MRNVLGWQKILIFAVLIRLLVMPFYFHPDIKTYHFQVSFLKQGVTNIYSYLEENKKTLPLKEEFVYFPLTYFFLGGYQTIMQPFLGGGFNEWLTDASQQAGERVGVFRYLFILKLPYFALDIAMAFLLSSFFKKQEQKKKVFTIWLFNPLSVVLIYAFGNLDIIPLFLILLSLYFAIKERLIVAAFLLGIGAGFKAFPLLFVPFLLLSARSWNKRLQILVVSLLTFGITIAPFLNSVSFREATLTSGLMTRLTLMGVDLGFNEKLMGGVVLLAALFFLGLSEVQIIKEKLWKYYLAAFAVLFSFIHFHIQWLIWILPFIAIAAVYYKRLIPLMVAILSIAFIIPLSYEDGAMTTGLFSVISPLYKLLPIPFGVVQRIYDPYVFQSILHSLLTGGSLVLIWSLFKEDQSLNE